jgi:hypothetical protein
MKFLRAFFIAVLLLLGTTALHADIATAGEHDVYIELLNAKDFPSYKFYIQYQTYTYNRGYQPNGTEKVFLEPGKHIKTGDRGSASLIYASGKGREYVSKVEAGGSVIDNTEGLEYMLDRIKIVKLDKKVVKFVVVERQLIGADGKAKQTIKKGSLTGQSWLMYLLPIICVAGLVAFFLFRRKSAAA